MRNLKKILALVLALVMSLSLMATAGAGSFSDVEADNQYKTAIDVLDELKVFQGFEDQTFRPEGKLNRAQAAVLVYRIATGDVEGKYVANYTEMANSQFVDLDGYNWAKGYINYCQNAKYVIGTSANTFDPGSDVTGYQLLVMLLRVLGYGQAGEFSNGRTWELETAKIAEREGILKNVTTGDLGAAAPRAMVAEILFQGLLTETVQYSIMTPDGYTKTGTTLGLKHFGLESVAGVVIANEWANLNADTVLAADTTRMETTDGKIITLNKGTDLDAVGQTHVAYIADSETKGVKRALTLALGENVVAFNDGDETSVSDLAKTESLSLSDADYYVNYKENWKDEAQSDILIRYSVYKGSIEDSQSETIAKAWIEYLDKCVTDKLATVETLYHENSGEYFDTEYVRTIRPHTAITSIDLAIMQEIFYSANRFWKDPNKDNNRWGYVEGEVFVGTASIDDVSDTMSWNKFEDEYLDYGRVTEYTGAEYGESLRVIDNNGDGKAEYVFKIEYTQDKVIATYKDELVLNSLKMADYTGNNRYDPDEVKVGDIVNYDIIDGKLSIWKADIVPGVVTTKNFRDNTVTIKDEVYNQSGITNATELDDIIMNMDDKVEYNSYLDEFGHIRTYELANGPQYGLLTEMYPTTTQNWNYVNTNKYWAELTIKDGDTIEYTTGDNAFRNDNVWTQRLVGTSNLPLSGAYNYLQPAIAHLGFDTRAGEVTEGNVTAANVANATWNRNVFVMDDYAANGWAGFFGVFAYRPVNNGTVPAPDWSADFSFTNIARYVLGEDGESVSLSTASQRYVDKNGNNWFYGQETVGGPLVKRTAADWAAYNTENQATVPAGAPTSAKGVIDKANAGDGYYYVYATDYVQLEIEKVSAGKNHWGIDKNYTNFYNTNSNSYVDALDSTEVYVVYPKSVKYYEGFRSLPTLEADKIRAVYAVAQNTAADNYGEDYWTADVIVIEVTEAERDYDSISLMYYNPYETSGSVRYLNSLNNQWRALEAEDADITVSPKDGTVANYSWGNHSWTDSDYGFYDLYHSEDGLNANGELVVDKAVQIPHNNIGYNAHGIYAGVVTRMNRVSTSHYIDVDRVGINPYDSFAIAKADGTEPVPFYKLVVNSRGVVTAEEMFLSSDQKASDVLIGDYIIWVYAQDNKTISYVVDLGPIDKLIDPHQTQSVVDIAKTPAWLVQIWKDIATEQGNSTVDPFTKAKNDAAAAIEANDAEEMEKVLKYVKATWTQANTPASTWPTVAALIKELEDAIANQPVEEAIRDAIGAMEAYREEIAEDYSSNPNLADALDVIDQAIEDARTTLDANKVDTADYSNADDLEAAVTLAVAAVGKATTDPATGNVTYSGELATIMTDLNTDVSDALQGTPAPTDPVRPGEDVPEGVTVTENEDDPEVDAWDVNIPKAVGDQIPAGEGTKIPLIFKSNVTPSVDEDTVPVGFTADLQPDAAAQTQSAPEVTDVAYTLTITKAYPNATWPEADTIAITIILTSNEPDEPTPEGDATIQVWVGNAVNETITASLSAKTVKVGGTIPTLTFSAPAGQKLPADKNDSKITVTMNGEPYTNFSYNVADNDSKATLVIGPAGKTATGNIVIGVSTLTPKDAATVTATVTKQPANENVTGITVTPAVAAYQGDKMTTLTVTGIPEGWTVGTDSGDVALNNGDAVSADTYTYNTETNTLTFKSSATATYGATNALTLKLYQYVDVTVTGNASWDGTGAAVVKKGVAINTLPIKINDGFTYVSATYQVGSDTAAAAHGYNAQTNTLTLTDSSTVDPSDNITIAVTAKKTVNVTMSSDSVGLKVKTPTGGKTYEGNTLALAIVLDDAYAANYRLPAKVDVKIGSTVKTDCAVDAQGVITTGVANVGADDIEIVGSAVQVVTLTTAGDAAGDVGAVTAEPAIDTLTVGSAMPTITIAKKDATDLPAADSGRVTVSMWDGSLLKPVECTYEVAEDGSSATIKFAEGVTITGNIVVNVAAAS